MPICCCRGSVKKSWGGQGDSRWLVASNSCLPATVRSADRMQRPIMLLGKALRLQGRHSSSACLATQPHADVAAVYLGPRSRARLSSGSHGAAAAGAPT